MAMETERKRMPHLTAFEKETLLELTVKYRALVENKKTDATSTKEKNRGWKLIEEEFNSLDNTTHRSCHLLKKSWENIKHAARKANRSERQHCLATGGGGPSREVVDPFLERVETLMPHINLRLSSEFDSDGYRQKENEDAEEPAPIVIHEEELRNVDEGEYVVETSAMDPGTPSPTERQSNFESGNKRKKMETPREVVKKYIEVKAEEEMFNTRQLHELKMANKREYHKKKMEYMEELHKLELEEKRLKIELLKRELNFHMGK